MTTATTTSAVAMAILLALPRMIRALLPLSSNLKEVLLKGRFLLQKLQDRVPVAVIPSNDAVKAPTPIDLAHHVGKDPLGDRLHEASLFHLLKEQMGVLQDRSGASNDLAVRAPRNLVPQIPGRLKDVIGRLQAHKPVLKERIVDRLRRHSQKLNFHLQ